MIYYNKRRSLLEKNEKISKFTTSVKTKLILGMIAFGRQHNLSQFIDRDQVYMCSLYKINQSTNESINMQVSHVILRT